MEMRLPEPDRTALIEEVLAYSSDRLSAQRREIGAAPSVEELRSLAGDTITSDGLGAKEAFRLYRDVIAPACVAATDPRYLAFVPAAPTDVSVIADWAVTADNIYAGSWMEGAGAVFAENEALAWVASLAGYPDTAGGVFLSGGTAGNLSALVAARWAWRARVDGRCDRVRALILCSSGAHSSVTQAARVMDADVITCAADEKGRLTGPSLLAAWSGLDPQDRDRVCAIVATAGTTNAGAIDDLEAVADLCEAVQVWMHVDAAYGGAALGASSRRALFAGIERSDSIIVDPHKWWFAPYDCCALVYRNPEMAKAAHTQHAEYLDVLQESGPHGQAWNPSDYAHHLSRRARGLPFWLSLAAFGTKAYAAAVETTLDCAVVGAQLISECPYTELVMEPELSVLLLRRLNWGPEQYRAWSESQILAGNSFVVPTTWEGETILRLCIVNPATTVDDIAGILASLADE
jgi:L-2,4-diaminobutyrate decarboxylase